MEGNLQITLFFNKRTVYEAKDFISEANKHLENLGEAITVPVTVGSNNPHEDGRPHVIFDKRKDFHIYATFRSVGIIIFDKSINKQNLVSNVLDILSSLEVKVSRIGYVSNEKYDSSRIEKLKKNSFSNKELLVAKEFEIAWHKTDKIEDYSVNFWQRYSVTLGSEGLYASYDINTLAEEYKMVDKDFATNFIEQTEELIELNRLK